MRSKNTFSMTRRLRERGNVFLALFGAVAIVGVIGGTAAGIMKGPMKVMSDVSSRAVAENEIMANTKMGIMAIAQSAYTKDCDNDGTVEPYPYNSDNTGKTGGVPTGGGYLPSELETTRWTDPWGNSYTYCIWDHGTLVDDATCGGAGQNRLPGLNTTTYPAGDVNKQTAIAVISSGPNRKYETTCQDWATADGNADGDLDDIGDTPLVNKPIGSDDIVMSYTYAEAAMATSSNWRIQSNDITTAEITEDEVEIGGKTNEGKGVKTTIGGSLTIDPLLGGIKFASDPGDDSITGACNPANDQALRINTGGPSKALEICDGGAWTPISGSSTTSQCEITMPVIANSGNAWIQDATKLNGALDIEVIGDYAYVANQVGNSFTVVDISDPLNPVIANSGNAWIQDATKLDGAFDIEIVGNYAYVVSNRSDSLTVIDISNPLNPVIANSGNAWVTDAVKLDAPWTLDIVGNYAYVSSWGGHSLTVIDISDPLNPVIANAGNAWVTDATKLFRASSVKVSGNYAYVTSREGNSFTVIDISDPLNPVIANAGAAWVQDATKLQGARDVDVSGNYAYVTSKDSDSFTVIDISDPLNPAIADSGNAWIQDATKLNGATKVTKRGNHAFVTSYDGDSFTVIDISDPLNPAIADSGNAWIQDATKLDGAFNVNVVGSYTYIAAADGDSLTVIDLGCDPTNPVAPITGTNIGFDPELANCVANQGGSLSLESTYSFSNITDIWSDGTYIYVADGLSGVHALTFDGTNFSLIDTYDTPDTSQEIWSDGTYIYVADGSTGVLALSFDGTTFTLIDTYDTPDDARGVWGDGTYIYVTDNTTGVLALSFDGTTFTLIDTYGPTGSTNAIWGDGNYIYVGEGNFIHAFTFNGSTLSLVTSYSLPHTIHNIHSDKNYIYIAGHVPGVHALTFDGSSFSIAGTYDTTGRAFGIWTDGTYIYAKSRGGGFDIFTFDGATFTLVDADNTPGSNVWGDGTYIYTDGVSGNIQAYSGFECTKAGQKTPGHALEYNYTAEQLFETQTSATGSAESYGTAILLKSDEFGDEAGFSVNVDSALGDDEIPSAAITAARTGINGEGALLFKTQGDEGNLNTNMMFDSDGDLGINTSAPFNVSGQIQIGDLASSGSDFFDPELANCVVNNGGPFVEIDRNATLTDADGVWGDGTYIYTADGAGIQAFSFDGSSLTLIDNLATTGSAEDVWGDGTYLYTANGTNFIRAFTFDGTTLVEVGSFSPPDNVNDVWGDGTYIYAGSSTGGGIRAYTFNGTVFTELAFFDTPGGAIQVWGDGTYIYVADSVAGGVRAYTFDGTSFTEVASHDTGGTARDVWGDGTYIYVANAANGIIAFNFDGSTFTELGTFNTPDSAFAVWGDGTHIYVGDTDSGLRAYTFDGTTFTEIDAFDTPGQVGGVWGDGQYIYIADSASGLAVYSGFKCTKVDGWQGPTRGLLTSIPEIQNSGFDPKAGNCTANESGSFAIADNYDTTGSATDIWSDEEHIYVADGASGIHALTFNGTSFSLIDTFDTPGGARAIWGDNNYIYVADGGTLRAYTFNGASFTEVGNIPVPDVALDAWSDGTYIYVAAFMNGGIRAYTFNGTAFTEIDDYVTGGQVIKVWGDGSYIYTLDINFGIRAYSFNGTTLTPVGNLSISNSNYDLWVNNNIIYVVYNDGSPLNIIAALSFDGSTFNYEGAEPTVSAVSAIWGDGVYLYEVASNGEIVSYSYGAGAFTEVSRETLTSFNTKSVWGDGKYIYAVGEGAGITAYSGFECTVAAGGSNINGAIGFFGNDGAGDVDTNIIFSQGLDVKGTNSDGTTLTDILSIDAQGTTTFEQGAVDLIDEAGAVEFLSSSAQSDIAPSLILNRARGTINSAASVASGDILGTLTWAGYDSASIASNGNAAIYAKAIGAPSNGIIPNGLFMSTDSAGNALGSSDLALLSTGLVGIGTEAPLEELHVAGRIAMTEGIRIGYDNQCNTEHDKGFIRYVASDDAVEYCTASEWISITEKIIPNNSAVFDPEAANCTANNGGPLVEVGSFDTPGSAFSIWNDINYIYLADGTSGIRAYTFDGTNFTEEGAFDTPGSAFSIWGDGTYLYVADMASGIRAYTFDGATFTEEGDFDTPSGAVGVWGDGTYIYVADSTSGVRAYTFDGTTFTEEGAFDTAGNANNVWGDGTYIYVADGVNFLRAYTFDGTTFTELDSDFASPESASVWGDGTYIYQPRYSAVDAYTFDGTTLTKVGQVFTGDSISVWGDGVYIYATDQGFINVYDFDGTTFNPISSLNLGGANWPQSVWGDGAYIYAAKGNDGIYAYSGFECTAVSDIGGGALSEAIPLIAWGGTENTELKITASDGAGGDLFGKSSSLDGQYFIISAPYDDDAGADSGSAYIFDVTTGVELFKLTASDAAAGDEFGWAVDIKGNYAVIGAKKNDDAGADSGSAYIFDVTTGVELFKLTASDAAAGDKFGHHVAINEKYALISALESDGTKGSAYIFDVTTGTQLFKLTASDAAAGDEFGYSVDIDGNYAIVGSRLDDDDGNSSGSAYIFDVTTGAELFKLTASDAAADDHFGATLSINGKHALVGAWIDNDNGNNSGSAYIFDVTTGAELFKLTASDAAANDEFGWEAVLDGHYAVIGASGNDDAGADSGSAYIFDVTTGTQLFKLTASDAAAGDEFGRHLSIDSNKIIVSAKRDSDNGANSGSVYIYQGNWTDRHTSGVECYPDPIEIDNFRNLVASNPAVVVNLEITGTVKNCPLIVSTDGNFFQIMINGLDVYNDPFATVNSGDLVTITTISSVTANDEYPVIVTIGDRRALYTVHTAP